MTLSLFKFLKVITVVTILAWPITLTTAQIGLGDFTPVDCNDPGVQDAAAFAFAIYTPADGCGGTEGKAAKKGKKGGKKRRKTLVGCPSYSFKIFQALQKVSVSVLIGFKHGTWNIHCFMIYIHLLVFASEYSRCCTIQIDRRHLS